MKSRLWTIIFYCVNLNIFLFQCEEILGIDVPLVTPQSNKEEINHDFLSYKSHEQSEEADVHLLKPGFEMILLRSAANKLQIFCYSGEPKSLTTLLKTIELVIKVPNDNFKYYQGNNHSSVRNQYEGSSWFSYTPWRPSSFYLDIYNLSCIGIETSETFHASLKVRYVDLWRVVSLAVGVSLFVMAPLLAHNIMFHYVTGVSVGIFGSLLLIIFVLSRFVPKKTGAMTFLVGGWGLILYILQYLWNNCTSLLKDYHTVATGYIVVAGILSFAVVYRWGPIEDARTLQLVQWSLQLTGLTAIHISSQHKEFTLALSLLLLANHNFPSSWKTRIKTYWLRHFPPKLRLLTDEEYFEQSRIETKKALQELQEFCHSPNCNAWKTMSRLKTPQRFAEFVEGASHLTDNEILAYESSEFSLDREREEEEMFTSDDDDADNC